MPNRAKHRKQLSLRGLRTFCVAGKHLSFRIASEELHITASAVSRQIKALEQEVGRPLFDRSNPSLTFTEDGERLFDSVNHLITELDTVTAHFRNRQQRDLLRISVQPFFSSELLVPRLADFTLNYPHIDIHLDSTDEDAERHPVEADVSIRIFKRAPAGMAADAFLPLRQVPACSPDLYKKLVDTEGRVVQSFPILKHSSRTDDWDRWCEDSGVALPAPTTTLTLDSTVALVSAAERGVGVTLAPIPAANERFDQGHLKRLYVHEVQTPYRYYFVSTRQAARTEAVRAFRRWTLDTFAGLR
ncbi:MAG: LysR substrate-binding domain-containing protein [Pseudomonadota bacterium]